MKKTKENIKKEIINRWNFAEYYMERCYLKLFGLLISLLVIVIISSIKINFIINLLIFIIGIASTVFFAYLEIWNINLDKKVDELGREVNK